mmetsp:Transcript_11845/g.29969  ORF Transcript_11845/g.29969 Transcript_11845/m.29969 type:complete len:226 (-) Transcript_11845:230-907(-)
MGLRRREVRGTRGRLLVARAGGGAGGLSAQDAQAGAQGQGGLRAGRHRHLVGRLGDGAATEGGRQVERRPGAVPPQRGALPAPRLPRRDADHRAQRGPPGRLPHRRRRQCRAAPGRRAGAGGGGGAAGAPGGGHPAGARGLRGTAPHAVLPGRAEPGGAGVHLLHLPDHGRGRRHLAARAAAPPPPPGDQCDRGGRGADVARDVHGRGGGGPQLAPPPLQQDRVE